MRDRLPFFMALGIGLGLVTILRQHRKDIKSQQWDQQVMLQRQGTVFITGASSGIGQIFAYELARRGYNLVLLARREDRLKALAEAIRETNPVEVELITADLTDPVDLERAAVRIAEISDLDILVNNAGFGTGGPFAESPIEPELNMIHVHVLASVRLARAALPAMVARKHGGIINISSVASITPMTGNVTYGATKNYLNFFTQALNLELAGSGVRVQALCPGFTLTEFHDVAQMDRSVIPNFLWMKPEDVVRASLTGLREGREIVVPGRIYKLMVFILRIPLFARVGRLVQEAQLERMEQLQAERQSPPAG